MRFVINGKVIEAEFDSRTSVLDLLRASVPPMRRSMQLLRSMRRKPPVVSAFASCRLPWTSYSCNKLGQKGGIFENDVLQRRIIGQFFRRTSNSVI